MGEVRNAVAVVSVILVVSGGRVGIMSCVGDRKRVGEECWWMVSLRRSHAGNSHVVGFVSIFLNQVMTIHSDVGGSSGTNGVVQVQAEKWRVLRYSLERHVRQSRLHSLAMRIE